MLANWFSRFHISFPKKRKKYRIFVKNDNDDVKKATEFFFAKFQVYSILQSEIK